MPRFKGRNVVLCAAIVLLLWPVARALAQESAAGSEVFGIATPSVEELAIPNSEEKAAPRGLGDQQPAVIGAKIERGIDRWRLRPRRARVVFALGCRREAMGRRVCTRPGCDLRWATSPAVAGLVSLSLAVSRNHGSRARIAARPIHGVQPLTPGTADASSACRASGVLVLCRSIYQSLE